jgi:hypothetical protein
MTIKIGAIKYKVVYTKLEECGKTDFTTSTIYIDKSLTKEQAEVTLLHEIIHGINNQLSEKEVEFLAQALYLLYRDNFMTNKQKDQMMRQAERKAKSKKRIKK